MCSLDPEPTAFEDIVRRNFQKWIMAYHSGGSVKFNKEQMEWLMSRTISYHFTLKRMTLTWPFDAKVDWKMHQLGNEMSNLVEELNEALVA